MRGFLWEQYEPLVAVTPICPHCGLWMMWSHPYGFSARSMLSVWWAVCPCGWFVKVPRCTRLMIPDEQDDGI